MLNLFTIIAHGGFTAYVDPNSFRALALPLTLLAISVLAFTFSIIKIRQLHTGFARKAVKGKQHPMANRLWWWTHKWNVILVALLCFAFYDLGEKSLLFALAMVLLVYVLKSRTKLHIAGRDSTSDAVLMLTILFLSLSAMVSSKNTTRFVDQRYLAVLLVGGISIINFTSLFITQHASPIKSASHFSSRLILILFLGTIFTLVIGSPFLFQDSILRQKKVDCTLEGIQAYAETIPSKANEVSMGTWAKTLVSAKQLGLKVDTSPYIGDLHKSIVSGDQRHRVNELFFADFFNHSRFEISQSKLRREKRRFLREYDEGSSPRRLLFLNWKIHALILNNSFTANEKVVVENNLMGTFNALTLNKGEEDSRELIELLSATILLEQLGKPIEVEQHRQAVHKLLIEYWETSNIGIDPNAGIIGNMLRLNDRTNNAWVAVQLMRIFGAPAEIDLPKLKSNLAPWYFRPEDERLLAELTRRQVDHLKPAQSASLLRILAVENEFFSAILLIILCLYALLSSPIRVEKKDQN